MRNSTGSRRSCMSGPSTSPVSATAVPLATVRHSTNGASSNHPRTSAPPQPRSGPRSAARPSARRRYSRTLQEPQIERREHHDDADVHYQALPEVVPEEQDVRADHDGDHREHVKNDACLPPHWIVLLCTPE